MKVRQIGVAGALVMLLAVAPGNARADAAGVGLGMDASSLDAQHGLGFDAAYAQVWAGAWNERHGWGHVRDQVDRAADRGVVPVVIWYYWGNDISPHCVQNGCWSHEQGVHKDVGRWYNLAYGLADHLRDVLRGRQAIVVLETEFNKNGIATWDAFDGYLADHARVFRDRVPEARLALGFGNWGSHEWHRFDRAMGAVDYAGLQTMRASTRDTHDEYAGAADAIEHGVGKAQRLFAKPVILYDLALATYGGTQWEWRQEATLRDILDRRARWNQLGLVGLVYRALDDHPGANQGDYYGSAEVTFGLRRPDGGWKPALDDWLDRAGRTAPAAAPSGGIDFRPKWQDNAHWIEVVTPGANPGAVDARVNGGPWTRLEATSWGSWARSLWVPDRSAVEFRTWDASGTAHYSVKFAWAQQGSFAPRAQDNPWWIETAVHDVRGTKVEARVNGGAWTDLPATDWGTYARSLHAPAGSQVEFRLWTSAGTALQTGPVPWGG